MGMSELRASHKSWVHQWEGLPLVDWTMEIRRNHVEIIPLGPGTPVVLRYGDVDFKKQFMDITKIKAPLLTEPSTDIRITTSENLHAMIADSLEIATKEETIMSSGFIKLNRSDLTEQILKYPSAFVLLTVIAIRARRTDCPISGLKKGQALIGDYENYGMTHKQYRLACLRLTESKIAAIRGTNKGSIATLLDTTIYDLNIDDQGQTEGQSKGKQQGKPRATNKKERSKECKKEEENNTDSLRSSKIKFLDFIFLTQSEHEALSITHGTIKLTRMIEILNDYIGRKGNDPYKSHFYVLKAKGWVEKEYVSELSTPQGGKRTASHVPAGPPKGFASYSDPEAIKAMSKKINIVGSE